MCALCVSWLVVCCFCLVERVLMVCAIVLTEVLFNVVKILSFDLFSPEDMLKCQIILTGDNLRKHRRR